MKKKKKNTYIFISTVDQSMAYFIGRSVMLNTKIAQPQLKSPYSLNMDNKKLYYNLLH